MKICLVTAFPPSRGGLSEYGFHIARELQQNPLLSLTVLADVVPDVHEDNPNESFVVRCWNFNDPKTARKILQVIRKIDPDVVWFNLLFTTFGHDPLTAFRGLMLPAMTRMAGYYTHVTLHHLMDFLDLEGSGIRYPRLYRLAGTLATKMLLLSNSLSVLMPAYRNILLTKYGGGNVHFRTHGTLATSPEYPDFPRRGNPEHRIVAFGKWGTYKQPQILIDAFLSIADKLPHAKLVIAGGDHPRAQGYIASLARKYESPRIEFTGYVPEEKIAELFRTATVSVMPYSSATGASGVAHLACAYGVPIISSDITDFAHMAQEEDMAIDFYETGSSASLAEKLASLLNSPERQREMAVQNFSAALRMTMPNVINEYVRQFGVAHQTRELRPVRWFRKLPLWLSRSFLGRFMLRGMMRSNYRLRSSQARSGSLNGARLFNANGHGGRGHLGASGSTTDSDDVVRAALDLAGSSSSAHASARTEKHGGANNKQSHQSLDNTPSFYLPNTNEAHHAEREQARIDESLLMLPILDSDGNRSRGNGKHGSHIPGAGDNGWGEGTTHPDGEV
ncbi:MAG TPA: glycosyltransferase [Terriglobales bacterium]|jgi:glycosyltransferase involved in cell wall biosynthesis